MKKVIILTMFILLCAGFVSAQWGPQGTIRQEAEALNFGEDPRTVPINVY